MYCGEPWDRCSSGSRCSTSIEARRSRRAIAVWPGTARTAIRFGPYARRTWSRSRSGVLRRWRMSLGYDGERGGGGGGGRDRRFGRRCGQCTGSGGGSRGGPVSTKKHAVKVMIGGEEYTVRSDLPPEYTREVAAYVDQALKKVLSQGPIVETHKAAILAALDITNELFQTKKGEREVAARLAALADDMTKLLPAREVWDEEVGRRRREIERREDQTAQQLTGLETQARELGRREQAFHDRERALGAKEAEARARLEQIAGLTAQQAKEQLLRGLEDEARGEAAALARDLKEQARKNADREAKKILAVAIQRIAAEHTAESTVSAVALPSDEMKGRIIGREGRNIRAFEAATGVDVIIDDTPDTVVVSCFDPVRREVGRLALERLIADGRIHPGRIEEIIGKARVEVEASIVEAGEQAVYETGIKGMHPELVKLVGRMRYRTSYGQNILEHSKEVAWLAGIIAAELKLDVQLAKRGAP